MSVLPWLLLPFLGFGLTSCANVKVVTQTPVEALIDQRINIVIDNELSSSSVVALRKAGLKQQECMQDFAACLQHIKRLSKISKNSADQLDKNTLALFAELHYAKALQIKQSSQCQYDELKARKQYLYLTEDISEGKSQADIRLIKLQQKQSCLADYYHALNNSLRHSYAYLFYDELTDNKRVNKGAKQDTLATDVDHAKRLHSNLDIQTLDIYNMTSNYVIDALYQASLQPTQHDYFNIQPLVQDTQIGIQQIDDADIDNQVDASLTVVNDYQQTPVMIAKTKQDTLRVYLPKKIASILNTVQAQLTAQTQKQPKPKKQPQVQQKQANIPLITTSQLSEDSQSINPLETLLPTNTIKLSGLNSVSRREGLGMSFVAQTNSRYTENIRDLVFDGAIDKQDQTPNKRIYSTGNILLTGFVKPTGKSLDAVMSGNRLNIHFYDPHHTDAIIPVHERYQLAADFSANYGLWLAENQLRGVSIFNMLESQKVPLPRLFMLEPYDPDKRIIIMIHGLASSPGTWIALTNDILSDDVLRNNYQVWQVFYSTNLPMIENRYQIQKLIEATYQEVDPKQQHQASKHSMIISHSMGGVISRMMLSNDNLLRQLDTVNQHSYKMQKEMATIAKMAAKNPSYVDTYQNQDDQADTQVDDKNAPASGKNEAEPIDVESLDKLLLEAYQQDNIEQRMRLHALKNVDAAVFISSPFRGTEYADLWFTRALRRIIRLPMDVMTTLTSNLSGLEEDVATSETLAKRPLGALFLQNGASQLSDESSFMHLTKNLRIDPKVTYHTVIASNDKKFVNQLNVLNNSSMMDKFHDDDSSEKSNQEVVNQAVNQDNASDSTASKSNVSEASASKSNASVAATKLDIAKQVVNKQVDLIKPIVAGVQKVTEKKKIDSLGLQPVEVNQYLSQHITDDVSDGIVPYTSAHLDGAASETILSGGHDIHTTPQTTLLLREILQSHLKQYPLTIQKSPH